MNTFVEHHKNSIQFGYLPRSNSLLDPSPSTVRTCRTCFNSLFSSLRPWTTTTRLFKGVPSARFRTGQLCQKRSRTRRALPKEHDPAPLNTVFCSIATRRPCPAQAIWYLTPSGVGGAVEPPWAGGAPHGEGDARDRAAQWRWPGG